MKNFSKNIIFFLLLFVWLISFTSCEKNLNNWEKISKNFWNSEKIFFEWKNFLASSYDVDWNLVEDSSSENSNDSEDSNGSDNSTFLENEEVEFVYNNHKNKWFRDCIEQDFRCVWADNDCKYWLWQNVWWCAFWCWEWNNNVVLRKDIDWKQIWCNDKNWNWLIAKNNAIDNCSNDFYTWAVAWWWFCIDENPGESCENWSNKVCLCWTWNKWEMLNWKVKTTCESAFCKTLWITKVKESSVWDKKAYYLARCSWGWNKLHFVPEDWDKWKIWFFEIDWEKCEWDNIWVWKHFFKNASSLWICEKKEFQCWEFENWTWVWLTSWELSNQWFDKKDCRLYDEWKIVSSFKICEKNNSNNCISNWWTLKVETTDNTKLSFNIVWKNKENEVVDNWAYRISILWDSYTVWPDSLPFVWSDNIWDRLISWNNYSIEIVPAMNYTEYEDLWNKIETKYVWNTSRWITINIIWENSWVCSDSNIHSIYQKYLLRDAESGWLNYWKTECERNNRSESSLETNIKNAWKANWALDSNYNRTSDYNCWLDDYNKWNVTAKESSDYMNGNNWRITWYCNSDLHLSLSSPQLYNFVAGTKSWCESSIEKRWPWKTAVCTIWWGCWISCGKPWGWCVSANPSHRWACFTENDLISK